ncbi:MAG TPA: hypothetical protein VFJ16_16055 [Longimicrobium sp.]|nr:hypothetical protein [Longimicrobium sp.]
MNAAPPPATPSAPHLAFRRSLAAFARMGVSVDPAATTLDVAELPDAHPTYRAIVETIRMAEPGAAALLDDASLLDRTAYELGLFARLLRAAVSVSPPPLAGGDADSAAFATAPSVRLVRTRWNWDAFLAEPAAGQPAETGAAWVLNLPPAGPVQVRRLHPLPALLLEVCAWPLTRAAAAAAAGERVEGDPARIAELVHAQIDELCAAGLLRLHAPNAADHAVREMRHLLLASEAPYPGHGIAGMLARAGRAARKHAAAAAAAGDPAYPMHQLDVSVSRIKNLLSGLKLGGAFRVELEEYWASEDLGARVSSVAPLLDVLRRTLGEGVHALPPYVLT